MHDRRRRRAVRVRWRTPEGAWPVRARIERFVEPTLLLLLADRPAHGYELLEELPKLGGEQVDMGNLYRLLRALERDGLVASDWRDDLPGPTKRVYRLTLEGRRLLDRWAEALSEARATIERFLSRYAEEGR